MRKLCLLSPLLLLAACGGMGDSSPASLPRLSAATGATLSSCTDLATRIALGNTTITAANAIAAGGPTPARPPGPAHRPLTRRGVDRASTGGGESDAIGFGVALPP